MDGREKPTAAFPDRRHRPMLALSPRASASPKRHRIELGHHGRASRSHAVDPRARSPCCSTCACYATTHVGLWKRLCTHGPSAQRQSSWPHSWLCGECGQRVSSSAYGPCVHRTSRSPWPHAPRRRRWPESHLLSCRTRLSGAEVTSPMEAVTGMMARLGHVPGCSRTGLYGPECREHRLSFRDAATVATSPQRSH